MEGRAAGGGAPALSRRSRGTGRTIGGADGHRGQGPPARIPSLSPTPSAARSGRKNGSPSPAPSCCRSRRRTGSTVRRSWPRRRHRRRLTSTSARRSGRSPGVCSGCRSTSSGMSRSGARTGWRCSRRCWRCEGALPLAQSRATAKPPRASGLIPLARSEGDVPALLREAVHDVLELVHVSCHGGA